MGKKYIIELEDKPFHSGNGDFLYRVKGFNSLVFDMTGVGKLTPYTEPDLEQVRKEAYEDGYKTAKVQCNIQAEKDLREVGERHYQKGLSDAWDAARKVVALSTVDRREVFGSEYMYSILEKHTAAEAIEKLKAYEQERDAEIKVGDEVNAFERKPFIVTGFGYGDDDTVYCHGFVTENGISTITKKDECVKTGRHFPEIAKVLKEIKGGEQDG
ncbi:MAG: hypothetical protein U0L88_15210 [Acutalibacteraceae bacterium]|nr:hypothetical protein [Acutalibacteraceae bacterium]